MCRGGLWLIHSFSILAGEPHARDVLHRSLPMHPLNSLGAMQSAHGRMPIHTPLCHGTLGSPGPFASRADARGNSSGLWFFSQQARDDGL